MSIFPIHKHEVRYFVPMALMMVCVLFNYTILRATKDALIATSPAAGIETIPYLKSIFVMSVSAIFVVIYTKLSNLYSFRTLYISCNVVFITFFMLFAFVIYPNHHLLHPELDELKAYQDQYVRIKFLFSVWGVWSYSLFYIIAEMWGNIMIPLLFWQFANQNVRLDQAKRFYPMFILFGNIALVFSGTSLQYICSPVTSSTHLDCWGNSLTSLMILISVVAGLSVMSFLYADSQLESLKEDSGVNTPKSKKFKMGVVESFKYIFSNPYVGLIALLILSYSISINLVELAWKKQIALWYQDDASGYNMYMGKYVTLTGVATIVIAFCTKGMIKKYGWLKGALTTPLALAFSGSIFFAVILAHDLLMPVLVALAIPSTYLAMEIGLFQSIFTRGIKYTLFDTSKEMAYIPLDDEIKAKGKAVVDIMGARLGKTFGSWSVLILFYVMAVNDVMDIMPYLAVVVCGVMCVWLLAIFKLNKLYLRKTNDSVREDPSAVGGAVNGPVPAET